MISLILSLGALLFAGWVWGRREGWTRRRFLILLLAPPLAAMGLAFALVPGGLVIQKVLGHLIMPAGLLWLALLAASSIAWAQRRRGIAGLILALWTLHSIAGSEYVAGIGLGWLERDFAPIRPLDEEPFEAIFVLGGGTNVTSDGRPSLATTGDRVALAARMFHAGKAPILVASGRSIEGIGGHRSLAGETSTIWQSLGVPPSAIVLLERPRNTSEEVRAYRDLAAQRGWRRMGIVTSAWHLRRTMRRAEAEGLDVHPLPADPRGGPVYEGLLSFIPNGRGYASVHLVLREIVGALVGR